MKARIYNSYDLQSRIAKAACEMDCKNIQNAKQGKSIKNIDDKIFELMFIHEFLPFFNGEQLRQKECLINEKYKI